MSELQNETAAEDAAEVASAGTGITLQNPPSSNVHQGIYSATAPGNVRPVTLADQRPPAPAAAKPAPAFDPATGTSG